MAKRVPSMSIEELLRVKKAIETEFERRVCVRPGCGHSYGQAHLGEGGECWVPGCACCRFLEVEE